ncbi:hypothetical protein HUU05_16360 [candidate division KSB1 bacterium]|nr:hypothetical protein [candidate division KSB1 bacterium]
MRPLRQFFPLRLTPSQRGELRVALVFLALIFIPSGLLGYLGWRALENEKLLAQQRLQESYQQINLLAAREINDELADAEKKWVSVVRELFKRYNPSFTLAELDSLLQEEPLIGSCYVLVAPGKVIYPPGLRLPREESFASARDKDSYVHEHEVFAQLVARGEEHEYAENDCERALAVYREALHAATSPSLRAMAESYIGRALMKKGEWREALAAFQHQLTAYPEAYDLNGLQLRFLAQYQIASALDNMGRDQEAVEALLRLNTDLLERSDAINALQYSYFLEQTQSLAQRLLASTNLPQREFYETQFRLLADKNKKRISQRYYLQVLDRKLNKLVIERKQYGPKFRYLSDEAENEPYLLAYCPLPDPQSKFVTGLLGLQIDLPRLRQRLFPAILKDLKVSEKIALAILNEKGDYVIGTERVTHAPMNVQNLKAPFDFWQVAVYVHTDQPRLRKWDFHSALGLWGIALLLLSILSGAYIFIRRARRAAQLSQMKSTFVSNVSHELRTPLASIKMMAELLEMQVLARANASLNANASSRAEQYFGIIRRECDRLGRLIENVLSFAKVERGVTQYHFEFEDVGILLHMALDSFRAHAEAQGFTLTQEIAEDLPELRLDADAFVQVMLNLLGNAVKYSAAQKAIHVRAYREGARVAVAVTDRGLGIPRHALKKIFHEFYRVDQRLNTEQQGGMGLGLTLTKHIVEAHGGEITVQSEIGRGSTFTVYLPIPDDALLREKKASQNRLHSVIP